MLTREMVEKALPSHLKVAATDALTDKINSIVADPIIAEQVRDNFLSYTRVLQDGKFKTEDYLNAVVYVSHKLMGMSNQDAYIKTFPDRYQALMAKGTSAKDVAAYVSAYAKGKLVNALMEQTLIPSYVLNQDIFQAAINRQAWLMMNAKSEMVQSNAANSLLNTLQKPKEVGPLVSIDMRESSGMTELKEMLGKLALRQKEAIEQGLPTKEVAAQRIIDVDPENVG